MIFLVVVPLLAGLALYLVPLQLGRAGRSPSRAWPRSSFWLYVFGGVILYLSFLAKGGPASTGWSAYAPLSTLHAPGNGQDFWILALVVLTVGGLLWAINLVATIHTLRAPRDELDADAALRLVGARVGVGARASRCPGFAAVLTMLALDRDDERRLLRPGRRRQPGALPAPLLVLRAPAGLRADPAGDGDRLRDRRRVLAQADLRLPRGRASRPS